MRNFSLRLRPPENTISYDGMLTVYLSAPSKGNIIGKCSIEHDSQSMIGVFKLSTDVHEGQFVLYLADLSDKVPHMYGILISDEGTRANTIKNSLIG